MSHLYHHKLKCLIDGIMNISFNSIIDNTYRLAGRLSPDNSRSFHHPKKVVQPPEAFICLTYH